IGIEGMIDNAIIEFFFNHTFDDFLQLRVGDDVVSGPNHIVAPCS
ncbi:35912_t:CDS:2, partial [Gigaspora margarita]